ncbi:MAG: NGG1p interacting factor NIF3 [Patescibacteria group bacterium]|nr:NGG1p interacting factor NIF3 [Patescibacteria group bacterium]
MTQEQIYQLAIKMGIEADLRGKTEITKMLKRVKEKYEKMSQEEREEFDLEKLKNPYTDTRILVPTRKKIKKVLVGIDIGVSELLLADRLGKFDLIISHHPSGRALAGLDEVMKMQVDILASYGIPIHIAESLLKVRIDEVARKLSPTNHNREVDAARLLGYGFMCLHTVCDNLVTRFLKEKIEKERPEYISDVLKLLKSIPEYQEAIKIGAGPRLFTGSLDNRTGKVVLLETTGGTEGAPEIYHYLSRAGIGTIVGMHISETHKKQAEKAHLNVIIAGHISSDSLGMNLFLDELEKRGIEIVPCSGLIRIKRWKK